MEHPSKWARFMAHDKNGQWWLFENEPFINSEDKWESFGRITSTDNGPEPHTDWRYSLTILPRARREHGLNPGEVHEYEPIPTLSFKSKSAPDLLHTAAKHMADRAATYDKPEGERSMGKTVEAFNIVTGRDLTESEGWLLMSVLKLVRDRQRANPHVDSIEDNIAYAALYGEARLKEVV